jgi:hypothetical protein
MRVARLVAVVVSLCVAGAAQAFEADGFRSGMPIEDALKLAREKGYAYKEPGRGFSHMSYGSTNGGPGLGYAEGKLCTLGGFGVGDLHRFVELVNQRASLSGPPTYTVHEEIMGNGNKFSQLAAKWRIKSDYMHVIIGKVGTARDTISYQYRDLAICPES